jgi:hypothetical protein
MCADVEWIHLALDRDRWCKLVNMKNIRVPEKARNSLTR